ncbi:MAG: hypothetical protein LBG65_06430 [Puniceicoccales bacterium]|nr:hypothetical protein [Puniceicoccales bacterium]
MLSTSAFVAPSCNASRKVSGYFAPPGIAATPQPRDRDGAAAVCPDASAFLATPRTGAFQIPRRQLEPSKPPP